MQKNIIDAETGEIYINTTNDLDVNDFLVEYECRVVDTPDRVPLSAREEGDIYVIPSCEVC